MTNYWCVNFEFPACLDHGIKHKFWLMQYQYEDEDGNEFQGGKRSGLTTFIWRRMKEIRVGDKIVAYLPGSRFFAIGTVIRPRKKQSARRIRTVDEYVDERDSHSVRKGYVCFSDAPAFYEDFSDAWRHPDDEDVRYAQRIDVDAWHYYVPQGIEQDGLVKHHGVPRIEVRKAAFRISKRLFDRIEAKLLTEFGNRA